MVEIPTWWSGVLKMTKSSDVFMDPYSYCFLNMNTRVRVMSEAICFYLQKKSVEIKRTQLQNS